MNSIQVSIKATEQEQELLMAQLIDTGATGFEQTNTHLLAYFDELNFDSYLVSQIITEYPHQTLTIEDRNWNAVWESNFQPVVVEDFCGIRAEFHPPIEGVTHEIVITPKMSFGTGHHATTYMMLRQMKDIQFTGKKVFDFGTGTGILAILAEKLGALSVYAIDVDEWSIENTKENAERNNCSVVDVSLTSLLPDETFDIILANINRNVILQYLNELHNNLITNGFVLFSGILITDSKDVIKACNSLGLTLVKNMEMNNWVSLLFIKP
ncbi:MAG TPA: 50S ribosomal protein L11 methyltransferase [Flavisolibacter sp.]|nr:50S ribosomal protein L11 methyltransferase [Flavisolibacter sp.]